MSRRAQGWPPWGPTSKSNNSSKISADAARLSNSIVEAGNSNASDALLTSSASSLGSGVRVSTSAVEVCRSSSTVLMQTEAQECSACFHYAKMKKMVK